MRQGTTHMNSSATSQSFCLCLYSDATPCALTLSGVRAILRYHARLRSLSDIGRSTAVNDLQPSASFSARKNPQCIPANTLPVFSGLRPCIWPRLLRLVTKAMSDRLLAVEKNDGGSLSHYPFKRGLAGCGKTVVAREAGGTSETGEGSRPKGEAAG